MNQNELTTVPPWVRSFMVHVVKRCCHILIAWIDQMQVVDIAIKPAYNERNGTQRLGK